MKINVIHANDSGYHYFSLGPNKRAIIVPETTGSLPDFCHLLNVVLPKEFDNVTTVHVFALIDIDESFMMDIMNTITNVSYKHRNHPKFIIHIPRFKHAKRMRWISSYCAGRKCLELDGSRWVTFRISSRNYKDSYKRIGCFYNIDKGICHLGYYKSYCPNKWFMTQYAGKEET